MHRSIPLSRVIDLTDPAGIRIYNMTIEEARERIVASGDARAGNWPHRWRVRAPRPARQEHLPRPHHWPADSLLHRQVGRWPDPDRRRPHRCHPRATRSAGTGRPVPPVLHAHGARALRGAARNPVGCPDPNPTYSRFFTPTRNTQPADPNAIGEHYIGAAFNEIVRWLDRVPPREPIGVCFSGGIDSGAIFLLTYRALLQRGESPARLKAFTLAVDGGGPDVEQAREFLTRLGLELFLEPIPVRSADVKIEDAIRVIEDYKPLDVQSGAMALALCRGIRARYPEWKYLLDGDGGDENLKDYPIEDNPELTIRSVLNNMMLYQEGWGVGAIKHSLTYSGGLSRGYGGTYAPLAADRFRRAQPVRLSFGDRRRRGYSVHRAGRDWNHDRLYVLKGAGGRGGREGRHGSRHAGLPEAPIPARCGEPPRRVVPSATDRVPPDLSEGV